MDFFPAPQSGNNSHVDPDAIPSVSFPSSDAGTAACISAPVSRAGANAGGGGGGGGDTSSVLSALERMIRRYANSPHSSVGLICCNSVEQHGLPHRTRVAVVIPVVEGPGRSHYARQ